MEAESDIRLTSFEIIGLFGEFNHLIPFNDNTRVTALIGLNGVGKTACLRLIDALFRMQWSVFSATDFESIEYTFSNGCTVSVSHTMSDNTTNQTSDAMGVLFKTILGDDVEEWSPRILEPTSRAYRFESYLPFLTRSGPKSWINDSTQQELSVQEIVENFRDLLPERLVNALNASPASQLAALIGEIDCHLIETQRLLVLQPDEGRRTRSVSTLAISRKAKTLKAIIARELAVYASISQSLDRSFPKRVVERGPMQPAENLRENLDELDGLRTGLTEAGILDLEDEEALSPQVDISKAIAAVLSVYVTDTRKKLDVLATLQSRILLFIELIDSRFKPKSVVVDKEIGFSVRRSSEIEVPLEKLSSGEQHQLVLFFELLFELKKNALILIDEPELSLHVAWQKQFIPDLLRIIELNEFDVLLATHSPQLIGHWEDIIVELGDVD